MSHIALTPVLLGLVISGACGAAPHPRSEPETIADPSAETTAAKGVSNPALRKILVEHWDWTMETDPVWATTLGDHRFDDRLSDPSAEAVAAQRAKRRYFAKAAKEIPAGDLDVADQTTLQLFVGELEGDMAIEVCESHQWSVSARSNPVTDYSILPDMHKVVSTEDAENLLARYRQIPTMVDARIANLRAGAKSGRFANAETLRRTIELLEGQLAKPVAEWALMRPAEAKHPEWDKATADDYKSRVSQVVTGQIKPAVERFASVLREILPAARGQDAVGIGHMPGGVDCYNARIRYYTALPLAAEDLHATGLAEIERINREMIALDAKMNKAERSFADLTEDLRHNPDLYFETAEQVVDAATQSLAAAKERMVKFFGRLPVADCVVVPIPDYEAPYTTIAYYREPHFDGTKPGEYFINTYKPETRPRFEMQVLAWHEAIPGHHLQIAISQELDQLPAFRRFLGSTAFVEGWALYTERLAEEMGLYSGDLDRMGMLSYDAWRAARLVVDTGIHVKGWTRDQAETYMRKHTALTEGNIVNEVDRYISWPGQALAYKVGQMEILRLRKMAEHKLAERFDLPAFHDQVLGSGAVSLPVLASNVERWLGELL